LLLLVTAATALVSPHLFVRFGQRPWAWPVPALSFASAAVSVRATRRDRELAAFCGSAVFLASTLLGGALVLFPTLLSSTLDPRFDLDATNSASARHGLALGLAWWIPALLLAITYFVVLFRSTRGKVQAQDYGH
jgi:cytochrome d ubiquinol oxidase subunit II